MIELDLAALRHIALGQRTAALECEGVARDQRPPQLTHHDSGVTFRYGIEHLQVRGETARIAHLELRLRLPGKVTQGMLNASARVELDAELKPLVALWFPKRQRLRRQVRALAPVPRVEVDGTVSYSTPVMVDVSVDLDDPDREQEESPLGPEYTLVERAPLMMRIAERKANHRPGGLLTQRTKGEVPLADGAGWVAGSLMQHLQCKLYAPGWESAVTVTYTVDVVRDTAVRHLSIALSVPGRVTNRALRKEGGQFLERWRPMMGLFFPMQQGELAVTCRASKPVPMADPTGVGNVHFRTPVVMHATAPLGDEWPDWLRPAVLLFRADGTRAR